MSSRDPVSGRFLKRKKESTKSKKKSTYPDCFIMGRAREGTVKKFFRKIREYLNFLFDEKYR